MNLDKDIIHMPAREIPSFRTMAAVKSGVADNILFTTWGGIGDQICAEPTLRFALDTLKGVKISLYTDYPELYTHLKFDSVFTPENRPDFSKYLVLNTITNPETLVWEFVSHCVTHCVDFPSLCALRCTIPISYKAIQLPGLLPLHENRSALRPYTTTDYVAVHAGKHWESKTFPAEWWDKMLEEIKAIGKIPVLVGKELDAHQGTVEVNTEGCIDLRNCLSLSQSIWLLQRMKYLVCNDSSPMHMAASGSAHIAFVATAKHQDYLYHWRLNQNAEIEWAWRMQHFNKGGMWDLIDNNPNKEESVVVDKCPQEQLVKWLPEPKEIADWIKSR